MGERRLRVLFLSHRNSVRSIIAEALLNAIAPDRFTAHSAGVEPAGQVHPLTVELLERNRLPTAKLRPKHWLGLTGASVPLFDFVFVLSETAAGGLPAAWPGSPVRSAWFVADPLATAGPEEALQRAFLRCYTEIEHRLLILVNLPLVGVDRVAIQQRVDGLRPSSLSNSTD